MSSPSENKNNMTYVRLGKSGLKVSQIILGCMSYGTSKFQDWVLDEAEGKEQIKTAYDLGINTFDTADCYSNGLSEVVLGKAIKEYNLPRDEIVVMSKFWFPYHRDMYAHEFVLSPPSELDKTGFVNRYGGSRKHIFDSIKKSLERLQLDYVDVYQMHRFDPETPIEETMQALHDIVKAGYARYIGMSSCYAWQFRKMQAYAKSHGLTEFISMQNFHNAAYREEEREMAPLLQDLGVGMVPWSPLARGFLARPIAQQSARTQSDPFYQYTDAEPGKSNAFIEINKRVEEIAKKRQISMAQVALAWSLSKPFVTAPIVGTTKLHQLEDLCKGVHLKLTTEEVSYIDEPYQPTKVIGFQ